MKWIMKKNRLIVFIGKPGAGKSTLIDSLFSGYEIVDVLPYVMKHKEKGKDPEARTIHAYWEMYEHIKSQKSEENLVLELGTNHPELNIVELEKLKGKFNIKIFLCDAPKHVCRERAEKRGRKFDKKALTLRIERDFPNSHVKLLQEKSIKYDILDMTRLIKEIKAEVEKIID